MAIESMLPRSGGGISDIVFNITTSPILASKTVTATDGVTTVTATTGVDGKATIKVKQGGTYTITCEGLNRKINAYTVGVYEVEISPSYKTLTFNGAVTLAPTMDRSKYTYAEDYNKPNSVDGFQVQAWSGDKLVGVEFFENETAVMTIDTRLYNEVTIKYSSEDGFTKPTDETVVLSTDKTLSPTWVEQYAVLEVTRASDLYSYDVEVKWGESADQKITYTEKDTDKSIFICKFALAHAATCGEATPQTRNVYSSDLDGRTLTPPLNMAIQKRFYLYDGTRSTDQECTDNGTGGWSNSGYSLQSKNYSVAPTKTSNGFKCNGGTTTTKGWGTVNAIPFLSKYKKVCVSIKGLSRSSEFYYRVFINKSKDIDSPSNTTVWYEMSKITDVGTNEYTFDNSKLSGNYYVSFEYNHGDTSNYVEVESIWLE